MERGTAERKKYPNILAVALAYCPSRDHHSLKQWLDGEIILTCTHPLPLGSWSTLLIIYNRSAVVPTLIKAKTAEMLVALSLSRLLLTGVVDVTCRCLNLTIIA